MTTIIQMPHARRLMVNPREVDELAEALADNVVEVQLIDYAEAVEIGEVDVDPDDEPPVADMVFRASLAEALTLDSCDRQLIYDAVRVSIERRAELRHHLETVAAMLRAGDCDGAERFVMEVLHD